MLLHSGVFVCAPIKHGHDNKEMTLLGRGKATFSVDYHVRDDDGAGRA